MSRSVTILVIEENPDQQVVIGYNLRMTIPQAELVFSATPEETRLYLSHCFAGRLTPPSLVLLSIHTPHQERDGQLLNELRTRYARLPVVVLSTELDLDFVQQIYDQGAHSFIAKPNDRAGWMRLCKHLKVYWFGVVTLPPPD